jgi:hypothetical protein
MKAEARRIPPGLRFALVAVLTLALGGCFTPFQMVDGNFTPKGRSIAVIAALPEEGNAAIAALVADELRKQSRYQVMSRAQIAQALKPYPQMIKGPYRSAYFEIDVDWRLTDKQKLAAIQRSLGVDYLYVMWTPTAVEAGKNASNLHLIGQLFEFPGAKEVGHGAFQLYIRKDDATNLKKGAEKVARQLAEKTGMLADGKKQ